MNFVFINPDEMRAESIACYGHPLVRTPNLDRLAQSGTRFSQCHTAHTVCSPSRCCFLTGWPPHVRGHRSLWHLLEPDEPNLFRYLAEAGYEVIWYGKNDAFAPRTFEGVVTQTIMDVVTHEDIERAKRGGGGNPFPSEHPLFYSFLYSEMGEYDETDDYSCIQKAIEYIKSGPKKPFVLFLPTLLPHCPYHAPKGYHDMYDPDKIPPLRPICRDGKPEYVARIRHARRLDQLDDQQFREINAKYLGMISYVDSLIGDLLHALEESGFADDTAIFMFSDHGDWAGDYGLVEKWPSALDDPLTRVPLIVRIPGGARGHVVDECVQLHDIAPTVLELAGIAPRHTMFAESLLPQLQGAEGDPERAVFAEGGYDLPQDEWCFEGRESVQSELLDRHHIYYPKVALQQEHPRTVCRSSMIRTLTHKLVVRTKQINELYDLTKDPGELNNVYDDPSYAGVRRELESRLLQWYIGTSDAPAWRNWPRGFEI